MSQELSRIAARLSDQIFVDLRYQWTYPNKMIFQFFKSNFKPKVALRAASRCEFDRDARGALVDDLVNAESRK